MLLRFNFFFILQQVRLRLGLNVIKKIRLRKENYHFVIPIVEQRKQVCRIGEKVHYN